MIADRGLARLESNRRKGVEGFRVQHPMQGWLKLARREPSGEKPQVAACSTPQAAPDENSPELSELCLPLSEPQTAEGFLQEEQCNNKTEHDFGELCG